MTQLAYAHSIPPQERSLLWAPYYAIMEQQLGATATLIDLLNPRRAKLNATTWTGRRFSASGLAPTWTPSEALSAFDTPFRSDDPASYLGLAPILTLNGTDEEADTPDDTYWSRGNGAADSAFSVGVWVYWVSGSGCLLAKTDLSAQEEWFSSIGERTDSRFSLELKDESAGAVGFTVDDTDLVTRNWYFLVATYDGTGGATAQTGVEIYRNGVITASPARTENAGYVAMENLTSTMKMCGPLTTRYLNGKLLGGHWSPFFTQVELTPAQVANIYQNMRLG